MWVFKKGGSGTKDYQEALDELFDNATNGEPLYVKQKYFNGIKECKDELQELVNEKLEQESRKEKLIVGSEWVCEVDCYHRHGEHDSGNIILVNELMGNDVRYSNSKEDLCEMTIDQFLLCFKPIKEGDKDDR